MIFRFNQEATAPGALVSERRVNGRWKFIELFPFRPTVKTLKQRPTSGNQGLRIVKSGIATDVLFSATLTTMADGERIRIGGRGGLTVPLILTARNDAPPMPLAPTYMLSPCYLVNTFAGATVATDPNGVVLAESPRLNAPGQEDYCSQLPANSIVDLRNPNDRTSVVFQTIRLAEEHRTTIGKLRMK